MIELPQELVGAVEERLRAMDPRRLARHAEELSRRYRAEDGAARPTAFVRDSEQALAYAAWILPATHAQAWGALSYVPKRAGEWNPRTLLDLGSGPGTVAWAAADIWESLHRAVLVEREAAFSTLGRDLAQASRSALVREATWETRDARAHASRERFDLVTLAHVLSEMPSGEAGLVLRSAWAACEGVLVVVEPGTPAGFAVVETARTQLVASGAHILAPCPHERECPLHGGQLLEPPDWCHFAQRTQRPELQRRLKHASLPWEDAKFAFVAAARFESAAPPWARVLRHPVKGQGHVDFDLCSTEGRLTRKVARSHGGWKLARKLEWGDAVEKPEDIA
jgi:ribosomal protein RSM22 (predicted rRNA methylase)